MKEVNVIDATRVPNLQIKPATLKDSMAEYEGIVIWLALVRNNHKIAATARELGVTRPTLYEKMKRSPLIQRALKAAKKGGDSL